MAKRVMSMFAQLRAARAAGEVASFADAPWLQSMLATVRPAAVEARAPTAVGARAAVETRAAVEAAAPRAAFTLPQAVDGEVSAPAAILFGGDTIGFMSDGFATMFDGKDRVVMTGAEVRVSPFETMELGGDWTGAPLPGASAGVAQIALNPGFDYDLRSEDSQVAAGGSLLIYGMPLASGDSVAFDGSAETDGRFLFYGGAGADAFAGGAGADRIHGMGGGDVLAGGAGADMFVFTEVSDSTGGGYDRLLDFGGGDRIDLHVAVTGIGASVRTGSLSTATIDDDLGAALGGLRAGEAVLFRPDAGDMAGRAFVVVDANGKAGYQAGEDYLIELADALPDLVLTTDLFI